MKKRKILIFVWNLDIGGAEWVITNLCNEFTEKGIDVTLITKKGGALLQELNKLVTIKNMNNNLYKTILFLFKSLFLSRYDCVFSTQRLASTMLSILHMLSFSSSRLIIREAASNFVFFFQENKGVKGVILRILTPLAYKRADIVIANSLGTLNDLYKYRIIKQAQRNFIIPNPLALDTIIQMSKEVEFNGFILSRNGCKTIVSIGRLVPQKKMDVLIKAFSIVKNNNNNNNLHLIIIGDGEEKKKLENLVSELNLDNYVSFTGKLVNPYAILRKANLFVLASEWEGFGMVIVEALAFGVPVIATDNNSGPKYILNNGEYGKLIRVNDVNALANAIYTTLNEVTDKNKLKKRAQDFDKSKIAQIYIDSIFS